VQFAADAALLTARIELGHPVENPFWLLTLCGSPALQRRAAEIWTRAEFPADPSLPAIPRRPSPRARGARIRVGYFSADFSNHATLHLMAGVFEHHDRSRFEVTAFSFGPDSQDPWRRRVAGACEFIDVRDRSDREVALLARERQIDIAVDLKGFTRDCRTGIFALRAAPVQVSYLGYPGTMGAPYMDYLIADRVLIPPGSEQYYSEKIVYLPDSYQVNDATRVISERLFSRAELGLPATGFVYCCFNNNYKILPQTFAGWMRILQRVPGSVLWLLEDNAAAAENLRAAAEACGVEPERLVFAPRMVQAEHLARQRVADLFLDTLPCNAHTTASDALWAGLPLVTCLGESFAGRVAGSLLQAVGLAELITGSQDEYEALAVALAEDPGRLARIRERLAAQRLTAPLFNTALTTRRLEAAYEALAERYHAGLPPQPIALENGSSR
jgi:predicted O-linked N-acetylglucosamine transferase (SPINDLY family)